MTCAERMSFVNRRRTGGRARVGRILLYCALALYLAASGITAARAQAPPSPSSPGVPLVITPPVADTIDENHVSILSGRSQFTIPALKLGDVSFAPFSANGPHFDQGQVLDNNYGYIAICATTLQSGSSECAAATLQAIYGEARASFTLRTNGIYTPNAMDGSTFVDNGSTCTWTQRDGTKIIYAAYHKSGDSRCYSNNISQIVSPEGRIATYYYYGSFSTAYESFSPILSIATNSGYLLKYNYSGTPAWGAETSVVAINRAFQACDPAALSCALSEAWPTATLSWVAHDVSPSDNFLPASANFDPARHYTFTVQDAAHRKSVFELDSFFRVVSYQPPEASSPVVYYNLCSLLADGHTMKNCFGVTWYFNDGIHYFEAAPFMWDLVDSVRRNDPVSGPMWKYGASFTPAASPPGWSTWGHAVQNPLGHTLSASGNATPGMESSYGPTEFIKYYDGSQDTFDRSTGNHLAMHTSAAGIKQMYGYDFRANLWTLDQIPTGSTDHTLHRSAVYPETCTTFLTCFCQNIITCNKPTSATDANGNTTNFSYDSRHGGVTVVTGPAVTGSQPLSGVRPQTRSTYVQYNAWYLSSSGVMTQDTHPIWLLRTESFCRASAPGASGGCTLANDEVVTTYDYGPSSGPNNLLLRGKSVSADGKVQRTCYGHDHRTNKIWETSPNANRGSCPDY